MELSVMNEEEENHPIIDKLVEKPNDGAAGALSPQAEADGRATLRRFDPDVRITEAMRWHSAEKPASKKRHNQTSNTGPTWGHLLGQVIVGVIEILIPLAFIVGMIYWRAPWLFWAVVHFLRGEPILNF
ncbi:MAG: hypothetical protein ABSG63_02830 [Spirochaetia bacterium]